MPFLVPGVLVDAYMPYASSLSYKNLFARFMFIGQISYAYNASINDTKLPGI
jgi:hypothetical protein